MSKVNITQINAALGGIPLTATFITDTLRVATLPKQEGDKRAVYWAASEYATICDRAIAFITARKGIDPAAQNGERSKAKAKDEGAQAPAPGAGTDSFFGVGGDAASADPFAPNTPTPAATGWF